MDCIDLFLSMFLINFLFYLNLVLTNFYIDFVIWIYESIKVFCFYEIVSTVFHYLINFSVNYTIQLHAAKERHNSIWDISIFLSHYFISDNTQQIHYIS